MTVPAAHSGSHPPAEVLPAALRAAAIVLLLQSLGLLAATVVLLVKTLAGHPNNVALSLSSAALSLLAAVILVACARGLRHRRPSARTPVVVLELLALPVAYSLAFQSHYPVYGAPILLSALAVLYLVFTPAARAVLDREI